jgi:hypothetical protein
MDEYIRKCDAILLWATNKKWFDKTFIVDVKDDIDMKCRATEGQKEAIDKIIQKFHIKL